MATVYVKSVDASSWSRTTWDDTGTVNYVVGDRVIKAIADGSTYENLGKTYVCISDNNSTTDPEFDTLNWARVGFSKEYPFHAPGGNIETDFGAGEVYLDGENTRYRNTGSFAPSIYWHAQNFGADSEGTIVFLDGTYFTTSPVPGDKINYVAQNQGKVTINLNTATMGAVVFLQDGNHFNAYEGINFKIGGSITLWNNNTRASFKNCIITDEGSIYGNYTSNGLSFGYNNFLEFENCLIHLPNAFTHIAGYTMTGGPNGRDALWKNTTIAMKFGNSNEYEPYFYSTSQNSPLTLEKCVFYIISHVYDKLLANGVSHVMIGSGAKATDCIVFSADNSLAPVSSNNSGLIVKNPLFIDALNGDFRLRPTSPLIGGGSDSSKQALLEEKYPQGKWFDSSAAAGGDGSWGTPYNNYGEAINSFTGDEAVVLVKEGQHPLLAGSPDSSGAFNQFNDLAKVYSGGIKFIGMGSGSVFDTSSNGIKTYAAFWSDGGSNPNTRDTPFLFKDLDILLNNSGYINRGLITARRAEYINVNVTQAPNLGAIDSQLFDYTSQSGAGNDSGEYLKMNGCTINVSMSSNSTSTSFLVGSDLGLKQFSGCTFADLNRTTSTSGSSPTSFLHHNFGSYPGSYLRNCVFYSKNATTEHFGTASSSADLEIKNAVVYSTQLSVSISANWADRITVTDPGFLATEPHNFDLRLRPSSPLIGGIKTESTNVYYLQPGNSFNGDGSQKDASSMTGNGDAGPFNSFTAVKDAAEANNIAYGSKIVIVDGDYSWPSEFNKLYNSTTVDFERFHYHSESVNGVSFDAAKNNGNYFGAQTLNDGVKRDTSFTGITFKNLATNTGGQNRACFAFFGADGHSRVSFDSCSFLNIIQTGTDYCIFGIPQASGSIGPSVSITNSIVSFAIDGSGGSIFGYYVSTLTNWKIENNTFVNTSIGESVFNGRNSSDASYGATFLFQGQDTSTCSIKNNIFYHNLSGEPGGSTNKISQSDVSNKTADFSNNLFFNIANEDSTGTALIDPSKNFLDVDPLFVDVADSNFSLRPQSPLIGQG